MKNVYIVVPSLRRRDGTGDYLLSQAKLFSEKGFDVRIVAGGVHPNASDLAVISYQDFLSRCNPEDLLIYHYGIFDHGYDQIINSKSQYKLLYYHNQTNPYFFDSYDAGTANALRMGIAQIDSASSCFKAFRANSPYTIEQQKSRKSLAEVEWKWLPPIISDSFSLDGHFGVDKKYDICCLGRIVPHKNIHKALEIFRSYKAFKPNARMVIVGNGDGPYYESCRQTMADLEVDFFTEISDEARSNILSNSVCSLTMSAHEGYALPIFESVANGCLPFYGQSQWLHMMIGVDELRVALDDDYQYAAYMIHKAIKFNGAFLFSSVSSKLASHITCFKSDYQFASLTEILK